MTRILSTRTEEVEIQEISRSWRIQLFTDLNLAGNYVVEFFREKVRFIDGVPGAPEKTRSYQITLTELLPKEVTLQDGTVLSGAQVAEAVSKFGDLVEEEAEA